MKRSNGCKTKLALFGFVTVVLLAHRGISSDFEGIPPIANAGFSRYAGPDPIVLDGTASYDPDESGPLSYSWQQISGPTVIISDANTATPTISGFVQTEEIQECEFELIVRAGERESEPDTVKVVIVPTFVSGNIMVLENDSFDPNKPTFIWFDGAYSPSDLSTGGGPWNYYPANIESNKLWLEKANIISFDPYYADPGSPIGWFQERMVFSRSADQIIVFLSDMAPDYNQPIQIAGLSLGGIPAIDVALRLNQTYTDARYAINHVTFLDATTATLDYTEYSKRVASFLNNPVDSEQCWLDSYDSAYGDFYPSALNVEFFRGTSTAGHVFATDWYHASLLEPDSINFNGGVVAGAYWSVIGPGKNLQLAYTPETRTYRFLLDVSSTSGRLNFYDERFPARLPEPITLLAWSDALDARDEPTEAVLTCRSSENTVGYQLLFGTDPYRVMDFEIVSDTPEPPLHFISTLPSVETWWTIRAYDEYGSTIHADPLLIPIDLKAFLTDQTVLAYWRLDETNGNIASDSAKGNDGTVHGETLWQPTEGKVDGSLEFNGIDDYISTEFILDPKYGAFSIFAWIKGGAPGQAIISQKGQSGGTWLGIDPSGKLMTRLVPPPIGRFKPMPLESEFVITDDQWHHIGFVWDGSYRILYVDGIEVAKDTGALTQPLVSSNGGLYIGASKDLDVTSFFSGLIDDVRIYNKALTPEQIAALAQ